MAKDEFFMKEALKEAKKALKKGDWPIGAVIVLDGKIIARGRNKVYSTEHKLAHAEMVALSKAQKLLIANKGKCTIYSTCEPCPMCLGAMIMSSVKRLVFGIKENCGITHLHENFPQALKQNSFKLDIKGGVLADDCWELFIKGKPTQELIKNNALKYDYK